MADSQRSLISYIKNKNSVFRLEFLSENAVFVCIYYISTFILRKNDKLYDLYRKNICKTIDTLIINVIMINNEHRLI